MSVTIVFDVECVGLPGAGPYGTEERPVPAALCPPTAVVVAVGFKNIESGREETLITTAALSPEHAVEFEAPLLERTAAILNKATRLVTFNGRGYDLPVLIHRAIAHNLPPSRVVLAAFREYRFKPSLHIDMSEQFTGFGASTRCSLRAYAQGYGLPDPKLNGTGADVEAMLRDGRLAEYAMGDVRTTADLYLRWMALTGSL